MKLKILVLLTKSVYTVLTQDYSVYYVHVRLYFSWPQFVEVCFFKHSQCLDRVRGKTVSLLG